MPDTRTQPETPRGKRCLLPIVLALLGAALLGLAVFHASILRAVLHTAAVRLAETQGVTLDLEITGNPLRALELRGVRATREATGTVAGIDLTVARLTLDPKLPALLGMDDSRPIRLLEIKEASLTLRPAADTEPEKSTETDGEAGTDAGDWDALRWIPVRLDLADLAVRVERPGETPLNVRLDRLRAGPGEDGEIALSALDGPGIPKIRSLRADLAIQRDGDVILGDLAGIPGIAVPVAVIRLADLPRGGVGLALLARTGETGWARVTAGQAWRDGQSTLAATLTVRNVDATDLVATITGTRPDWELTVRRIDLKAGGGAGPRTLNARARRIDIEGRAGPVARTRVLADIGLTGGELRLHKAMAVSGSNTILLDGLVAIPDPLAFDTLPRADVSVDIDMRDPGAWMQSGLALDGAVAGDARIRSLADGLAVESALRVEGIASGDARGDSAFLRALLRTTRDPVGMADAAHGKMDILIRDPSAAGLRLEEVAASLTRDSPESPARAVIDARGADNSLIASAESAAAPSRMPGRFEIEAVVDAADLGALAVPGGPGDLTGSARAWLAIHRDPGAVHARAKVRADNVGVGPLQGVNIDLTAEADPSTIRIALARATVGDASATARVTIADHRLDLSECVLDLGGRPVLDASADLPFPHYPDDGRRFHADDPVRLTIDSNAIPLARLAAQVGHDARLDGTLELDANLGGRLGDPEGAIHATLRDVIRIGETVIEPATLDLATDFRDGAVVVDGALRQRRLNPLQVTASLALDPVRALNERRVPPDTPLRAGATLDETPLASFQPFLPVVSQMDGSLGGEVDLTGTLASPVIEGAIDLTVSSLSFRPVTLPSVRDARVRLIADRTGVRVGEFRAVVAGGTLGMDGGIAWREDAPPNLDVHLHATDALVARNDSILIRTDADLRATGPMDAATLAGTIGLSESRFYKDVNFLPVTLPGAPAPQIPSSPPDLTLADTPLADWTFDVRLTTPDPFLIRGNVANGSLQLYKGHLGGTGANPVLEGFIYSDNIVITLPYSRMTLDRTAVTIQPGDPLNPILDIRGSTRLRDYQIDLIVYGTLREPESLFLTQPPMTRENVLSLLATGATLDEISDNPSLLAGRAAGLLGRRILDTLFPNRSREEIPFQDRIEIQLGSVNARTGEQDVTGSFRINESFSLQGTIGNEGDYRAGLLYSIRFR